MRIRAIRDFWIHPLTLFASAWLISFGLYTLHLSDLLIVDVTVERRILMWILTPFFVIVVCITLVCWLAPKREGHPISSYQPDASQSQRLERSLHRWFLLWLTLTFVEVIVGRGLPILWLLVHSARKYNDFGLPFVHVFIATLLSVIAMGNLALFLLQGGRRRLIIPLFQIVWAIFIVSRGLMMVALLQYLVLWLCIRGMTFKIFLRTIISTTLVVLLFGYLGDLRSGSHEFKSLAQPTSNYPDWLPSGVLWFYIYLTSPLDNLGNTAITRTSEHNILFPRTTYFLYPTPLRQAIFGKDSNLGRDSDLVESSLNVSSAYIGPYVDYGFLGIAAYSMLLATISSLVWRIRKNIRGMLLYTLVAQCLVFSVFYNFLFYNPFLGQVFWIFLIFSQRTLVPLPIARRSFAPVVAKQTLEASKVAAHVGLLKHTDNFLEPVS